MTTITALPAAPNRATDDAATFSSKADTFVAALQTLVTQTNLVATETNTAASSATAASAAATSVSGATAWAGTTVSYVLGNATYSGVTFQTYRLKIASKAANVANTDPSVDTASWALVNGTGDVRTTTVQTLTQKTLASPIVTGVISNALGAVAVPSYSFTGDLNTGAWSPSADAYAISTGGLERFRLDAAGNAGLGVTPSAHATGWRFLDLGLYASVGQQTTGTNSINIGWNAAGRTGGNAWNYRVTGDSAKMLEIDTAGFKFYSTTTTGTAGSQITTFTQMLVLDGSGNLLLGTTSPPIYTSKIRVQGGLEIHGAQQHNVLPGNTNPYEIVNRSNGGFDFYPTSTILATRITSGGDFLVGIAATASAPAYGFCTQNPTSGSQFNIGHINATATGTPYANFAYNAVTIGSITQNGTTAVLYNTTSDQRLKTHIVDAPDASALIDSIQVRSFDWISDDSHQRYGMIAQELALVAPEAVHAPADPDAMMAVDYSKLVPMLVKEIQSLRARVAALEA